MLDYFLGSEQRGHQTLLQCMTFSIRFSSQKIPKMIGIKMITLSIWTSQHDWVINLDLIILIIRVTDYLIGRLWTI
jgi:hypothetical protein